MDADRERDSEKEGTFDLTNHEMRCGDMQCPLRVRVRRPPNRMERAVRRGRDGNDLETARLSGCAPSAHEAFAPDEPLPVRANGTAHRQPRDPHAGEEHECEEETLRRP